MFYITQYDKNVFEYDDERTELLQVRSKNIRTRAVLHGLESLRTKLVKNGNSIVWDSVVCTIDSIRVNNGVERMRKTTFIWIELLTLFANAMLQDSTGIVKVMRRNVMLVDPGLRRIFGTSRNGDHEGNIRVRWSIDLGIPTLWGVQLLPVDPFSRMIESRLTLGQLTHGI